MRGDTTIGELVAESLAFYGIKTATAADELVAAALLTADPEAPTARILDGMIRGRFPFVISVALLAEYRRVLTRQRIRQCHGLTTD